MTRAVDERLGRLHSELDDHARIAEGLGLAPERPLRSLSDGYPENTIALIGKLTEKLLKQLWRHHQIPSDPSGWMLSELIKGCQPHIRSSNVIDALTSFAPVLSAESSVVMSSRISFLADSPQVRRLLDHSSALSQQLVEQMYAKGVDPERMPHVSVLRLTDRQAQTSNQALTPAGASLAVRQTPLERRLHAALSIDHPIPLGRLLSDHIDTALRAVGLAHPSDALTLLGGQAFMEVQSVSSLVELHNALRLDAFSGGPIDPASFRLTRPCALHPEGLAAASADFDAGLVQAEILNRRIRDLTRSSPLSRPQWQTSRLLARLHRRIPVSISATSDGETPGGHYTPDARLNDPFTALEEPVHPTSYSSPGRAVPI